IGVSTAGVWTSHDGGASWQIINRGMYAEYMPPELRELPIAQDVHRLARCAAKPDTLWCQHHNGVFRSEDAGADWREITAIRPSKFGFAVAAHPHDPDIAWFVPAVKDERRIPSDGALVVARTRDGGASFEILRNGLPQRHAYDLVWRHALAVDETGDRLAFGSTSGGLWVSEDGGDSWTMPEMRLPPIAAVRFAPA
ncbi:MAG: WD40/YVTN/BNR-like repeat-containing protein, partial [Stellaceae bacterium]